MILETRIGVLHWFAVLSIAAASCLLSGCDDVSPPIQSEVGEVSVKLSVVDDPARSEPAVGSAMRGMTAVNLLFKELPNIALRRGISEDELVKLLLRDESLWITNSGFLFYADPLPSPDESSRESVAQVASACIDPEGLESVSAYRLHSKPGSKRKIFIDFESPPLPAGTSQWHFNDRDINPPAYLAPSPEETFCHIKNIWLRVATDFSPFDVDITTERPSNDNNGTLTNDIGIYSSIERDSESDEQYGTRVVVTDQSVCRNMRPCSENGGIAFTSAFDHYKGKVSEYSDYGHSKLQPAWVFFKFLDGSDFSHDIKYIADQISHEAGHTLGLDHHGVVKVPASDCSGGTYNPEYYRGRGPCLNSSDENKEVGWAPIMGSSSKRALSQWSHGNYRDANNPTQSDLSVIRSHGLAYIIDDHPSGPESYSNMHALGRDYNSNIKYLQEGMIGIVGFGRCDDICDVDYFSFELSQQSELSNIKIQPWPSARYWDAGINIDLYSEIRSHDGSLVDAFDDPRSPGFSSAAEYKKTLPAGKYYISVGGTAKGNPLEPDTTITGYSNYGNLGGYRISLQIAPVGAPASSVLQFSSVSYQATENSGSARVDVVRSGSATNSTSVVVRTSDNSAVAGSDYTGISHTLSWAANDVDPKSVNIVIGNDSVAESTESLHLTLSSPSGGSVVGAVGTATLEILDDDGASSSGVTTKPASNIDSHSATLNGVVNPKGSGGVVTFEYGQSSAGSDFTSVSSTNGTNGNSGGVAANSNDQSFFRHLSGLESGSTYYYRVVFTNSNNQVVTKGSIASFVPLTAAATTQPASHISSHSAALNGVVNPKGSGGVVTFEYGQSSAGSDFTSVSSTNGTNGNSGGVAANSNDQSFFRHLSGLESGSTYYYRVVFTNSNNQVVTKGSIASFVPLTAAATTQPASQISSHSATLNGVVNPKGSGGVVTFEYGQSSAGSDFTSVSSTNGTNGNSGGVAANSNDQSFFRHLSGLESGSTYYYRVVFTNSNNQVVTKGSIASFVPGGFTLTVGKMGNGVISSSPSGIDCGSLCRASFVSGSSVTLTAAANAGSIFNAWDGCDTTSSTADRITCTVSITSDRSVGGTFTTSSDTTPDAFSFTAQPGVPTGTVRTSNTITVSGITEAAPISVSNGSYSIGCTSSFVTTAGTISNGQSVCVRHTSSGSPNGTTSTPLTIGGVSGTFSSTTGAEDTTPNSFTFTFQTGVETNSVRTSNAVTIAGINAPTPISVSGGGGSSYSIGCTGSFVTTAGTISNGQTVCVRHTSASTANAITSTVLTVGSYSGLFRSTTGANDTAPNAFSFTAQTGVPVNSVRTSNTITVGGINAPAPISISGVAGGSYSIGCTSSFVTTAGTISNGQTVCVRHTASPSGGATVSSTLDIGGVTAAFSSTTAGSDTTPDAFSFTAQPGVPTGTVRTSNTITVSGITEAAPISVSNGSYSIGCTSSFVTTAGTISNGQSVCVRHTSSGSPNGTTSTPLTIGGVSGTFSSTTGAEDTTPNSFTFTFQTGVETNSVRTSNAVTIAGINAPTPISVSGGGGSSYSIGCTGSFVTTAGTISNGQTVCVRHTSASTANAITSTVLTVGSYSGLFRSTTGANDTAPNAFSFTAQTGVPVNSVRTSNTITVGGINAPAPISISGVAGGSYSIGCTSSFVTTAGTISNGQTVCVRHTASPSGGATVSSTLDIGGVTAAFSSTTQSP